MADGGDEGQERSLEPSQRKLDKAREQGQFPQSRDLSFLLIAVLVWVSVTIGGRQAWSVLQGMVRSALMLKGPEDPLVHLQRWAQGPLLSFVLWLVVFLLLVFVLAVAGPLALVKFRPVFAPRFDLSKLDPIAGLGRLASGGNLFSLVKGIVLTCLVLLVSAVYFYGQQDNLIPTPTVSLPASLALMSGVLGRGLQYLLVVLMVVAISDASFQWFNFRSSMKMSLQDQKDESKESEGSPETRGRIRSLQREASRRRMMSAVAKADVVVVNPTHFAVALRYDGDSMAAPTVVAKGTDALALRMRSLAAEHRVPVAEAPSLARWLSAHVDVDHPVPQEAYSVVAQLLAWAYATRESPDAPVPLPPLGIESSVGN